MDEHAGFSEPVSPALAVRADGLTRSGSLGPVFGPVDLRIPFGGLAVVQGFAGSGRTSLLLTLSGRMRPSSGKLRVLGRTKPAAILKANPAVKGDADLKLNMKIVVPYE